MYIKLFIVAIVTGNGQIKCNLWIDDGEHVSNNADTEAPETPFPV